MRRTQLIKQSGPVDLTFAGDIAIANVSGQSPMWVIPDEELKDVDNLEDMQLRNGVFNAMYRLLPGERRTLQQGIYQVILGAQAVAFVSCAGQVRKPAATKKTTPKPAPATEPTTTN